METKIFTIGLLDKDSHKQEFTTIEAFKIVQKLVVKHFGGGTISEALGVYKHNDGTIVEERSIRVETVTNQNHVDFINEAKAVLNQESVMYKKVVENVEFI